MSYLLYKRTTDSRASSNFKKLAEDHLYALITKIKTLINAGILADDFFAPNTIILYNSINNEFIEIELFLYLPIKRYADAAEGYFEKVVTSIYSEIQLTQSIPFISTISNSDAYFWAYSKYQMIALPEGEQDHLLNLGDLYHEIGHLIFIQSERFLVEDHLSRVNEYYNAEIQKIRQRRSHQAKQDLRSALECWEDTWAEELACDLIAAFLVGPAYAWSNLKVCTVSSGANEIFGHGDMFREHPPDEVRMRAILKMLRLIGCEIEANGILEVWTRFLSVTQNGKHDNYRVVPKTIILKKVCSIFCEHKKSFCFLCSDFRLGSEFRLFSSL